MSDPPKYQYVLYVDEAGDDGLKKVAPIDANGATEWLVISGVLVRAEYEDQCQEWLNEIRTDINALQSPNLHFRKLSPTKQKRAAEMLAALPVRLFTVCSNKKNMRQHNNTRAAEAGGKQWFYNWICRILMERVTAFTVAHSNKTSSDIGKIKVLFSARGGHSYGQTKAYWELLRRQQFSNSTYLKKYEIDFRCLSFRLVDYKPHYMDAGLQLADVLASAFYQAIETGSKRWSTEPTIALGPRVAHFKQKSPADFGLVLQPHQIDKIGLSEQQKIIFEHYGYKFSV